MRPLALLLPLELAIAACAGAQDLAPGSLVSETLAGGEERAYRIQVPLGGVAEVVVRQHEGMAGILTIEGEDGRRTTVDLARRIPSARSLLIGAGRARLTLKPVNHSPMRRTFEIFASATRAASGEDRGRMQAENLAGEGERILREFQPQYLENALQKFQASMELWRSVGDSARMADAEIHIGYVLHFQGKMAAAIEAYQQALDVLKSNRDDSGAAAALFGLAYTCYDKAEYAKALDFGGQALELNRAASDAGGESDALSARGLGLLGKGDTAGARASFEAMLDAARRAGDRVREADAHNDLAILDFQMANAGEAERHYREALAIAREENEPVRAAQELNNLGALFASLGENREGLRYFEEALPIRKTLAQPGSYANTLYNTAVSLVAVGEYQKALDDFQESRAIFRRVSHRSGEAYTLQQEALMALWVGDRAKAAEELSQALAIQRAISDRRAQALTLNLLGDVYLRQKDYRESLARHRESLEISESAGYQREAAQAETAIGGVFLASGEAREALEIAGKSLEICRRLGNKSATADALGVRGRAWRNLGEWDRAEVAFREELALRRETGEAEQEASALADLARVHMNRNSLGQASEELDDAMAIVDSIRSHINSRQSQMELAASHRAYYDLAIGVQMQLNNPARAFEISERARARGLLDLLGEAPHDLRQGVDPALLERERRVQELLDAKHDRLMRLLATAHTAALETRERHEVDGLVSEYRSIETEIRAKSPQYAALTQPRPLALAEVQALLPESGTVLVEFWLGEKRSYAWAVSKNKCKGFTLPGRAAVETLARRVYQALNARNEVHEERLAEREQRLSAARAEFGHAAAQLSGEILAPLGRELNGPHLWIVADGGLEYVPFAALPAAGTDAPLVKDHEIVGLPSASVLAAVREQGRTRRRPDRMVAVFADPVFSAQDERVRGGKATPLDESVSRAAADSGVLSLANTALPRLLFSREEAEAIRKFAPARQALTALDFDANRTEAKSAELARYRVVHFATHGLIDSRHPELSGVVLSLVDRNGHRQDGFLRLHEIYNLKLNADLVVLSGCQTALGEEVLSEGLIGMTRGFMYAGSQQVLASLWSVRDRAIAELMRRFYEGLLRRHESPESALRSAQLSMMSEPRWKDPYYWAAFTLAGTK